MVFLPKRGFLITCVSLCVAVAIFFLSLFFVDVFCCWFVCLFLFCCSFWFYYCWLWVFGFFHLAAHINFDLEGNINVSALLSGPEGCNSSPLPNCGIVTTLSSDLTDTARRNYCLALCSWIEENYAWIKACIPDISCEKAVSKFMTELSTVWNMEEILPISNVLTSPTINCNQPKQDVTG